MRNLFQRLNREDGTTIFISSHILSEVDFLADALGIIFPRAFHIQYWV